MGKPFKKAFLGNISNLFISLKLMFKGMSGKIVEFNYLLAIREISPNSGI